MTKKPKLTKVVNIDSPKTITYEEAILNHLEKVPEETKNSSFNLLIIAGMNDNGFVYQVVQGENIIEVVGLLETVKLLCINESTYGE